MAIVSRFNQDHCFSTAASLSYTTLLALVPLVTVVLSMLSLFPIFDEWVVRLEAFMFSNFVPTAGEVVQNYLLAFSQKAGKLTAVGLVFLVASSLMLLITIEDAFNDIWKVQKKRKLIRQLFVYWAVLTLGPLLIAGSLSMSSALLSITLGANNSIFTTIGAPLLQYLPVLFELFAFYLFYQVIPNKVVVFRHCMIGALVATILFEIAKFSFGLYILNFDSYERIYGALATIPIFFVWIYLCWIVLLIGALTSAVLEERH